MELVGEGAAGVDGITAMTGTGGVAALENETWDESVEDGTIVVVVIGELEEVADGEGAFFTPEFELEGTLGCVENYFSAKRWFSRRLDGEREDERAYLVWGSRV